MQHNVHHNATEEKNKFLRSQSATDKFKRDDWSLDYGIDRMITIIFVCFHCLHLAESQKQNKNVVDSG